MSRLRRFARWLWEWSHLARWKDRKVGEAVGLAMDVLGQVTNPQALV